MTFPGTRLSNRSTYEVLLKSFVRTVKEARKELQGWVDYNAAQPARLGGGSAGAAPIAAASLIGYDEDPEELPPVYVSGSIERVEYYFEYAPSGPDQDPLMPLSLNDAVVESGVDAACAAACYATYDKIDAAICRRIRSPQAAAICWAGAAAKLGVCLAGC